MTSVWIVQEVDYDSAMIMAVGATPQAAMAAFSAERPNTDRINTEWIAKSFRGETYWEATVTHSVGGKDYYELQEYEVVT